MIILKTEKKNLKEIVNRIVKGETVVFPTDTVYGLVCDATNKGAVARIFQIKKRSRKNPLPIFIKDIKMAREFAEINQNQEKFLKKSWPGKITTVLKKKKSKVKLYGIDKKTIALRIPSHKLLLSLASQLNCPLVGTSANISGFSASTKIQNVLNQFENKKHQPDFVIDGGNLPKSKSSKIIDLTSQPYKILRP